MIGSVKNASLIKTIQQVITASGLSGPTGPQGPAGPNQVTTSTSTNITGLIKGNGSVVSAASAPTDYVATGDSRLSDARTPTSHSHAQSDVTNLTTDLSNKVTGNGAITGATKTKVTYDTKGLITSGADATTADIADSSNKRYVTDAQLTVIGNTSGTNTGDQTLPVKATGAEINTGTDDAKFATPKAIADSDVAFLSDIPAAVTDATIVTADVTTNNATTSKHGWFPKLPTPTGLYLKDDLTWGTPAGGVSDGDKGDITVSSGGTSWIIDNGVVTAAKTSISGTPTGAKYLRDDFSWQTVTASTPDTLLTKNIIAANTTITAGYSAYIPFFCEISNTFTLETGLDSYLEVG